MKIVSPTRIEDDHGNDLGMVVDYIIAHPQERDAIAKAMSEWHGSHVAADQERDRAAKESVDLSKSDCSAIITAALAERDAAVERAGKMADSAMAERDAVKLDCERRIAEAVKCADERVAKAEADLAELGTHEDAAEWRKAKEIAKAQDEFAALGHRLRKLKGEDLKPSDLPAMTSTPESRA